MSIKLTKIKDIKNQDVVYGIFYCKYKELKKTKYGDFYINISLIDSSGSINAKLWKHSEHYSNKFDETSKRKLSICFGWTAAIMEALEREIEVVHICSDPILESLNEKIWKNLRVEKIDNFTFKYKLLSLGKYINFGKRKNLLKDCLEDIK